MSWFWNGADQRFYLPERQLEPRDDHPEEDTDEEDLDKIQDGGNELCQL